MWNTQRRDPFSNDFLVHRVSVEGDRSFTSKKKGGGRGEKKMSPRCKLGLQSFPYIASTAYPCSQISQNYNLIPSYCLQLSDSN